MRIDARHTVRTAKLIVHIVVRGAAGILVLIRDRIAHGDKAAGNRILGNRLAEFRVDVGGLTR